jgi:hypothetical protein
MRREIEKFRLAGSSAGGGSRPSAMLPQANANQRLGQNVITRTSLSQGGARLRVGGGGAHQ